MKYLTKEWYIASQLYAKENCFEEIPDKKYSDEEIETLHSNKLSDADFFEENYQLFMDNPNLFRPKWILDAVDHRLVALGLLPSSAYKRLSEEIAKAKDYCLQSEANFKKISEAQTIPNKLADLNNLHDTKPIELKTIGSDIQLTLTGHGTYKLVMQNAQVIEDEISDSSDDILFLNYELYNTPTGYNFHMMFWGNNNALYYYTLDCSDIDFSYSAPPDTEIIL
ncbi:MAG: DUF4085 domain-containing protein [Lachnospiraceae bacterium]|nr:DUF4085 domain-containing protein [Lachnospiraceae bacterium]